ncbi:MAG: WecB/TagA/CpsF family glycosyltransferase [Gordonia paraffinivorans]
MTFSERQEWVGTVPVAVTVIGEVVDHLVTVPSRAGEAIRLISAKEVAEASVDPDYRHLLAGDGINIPDGTPVTMIVRAKTGGRGSVAGRTRGATLFRRTLDRGRENDVRHFFLGGSPETLERLLQAVERSFPGVRIAGSWSPPFAPLDASFYDRAVAEITQSGADVVWVGLGAPKQDWAVTGLAARTTARCVAVGAAFDFLAGTVAEAPRWVQRWGMEWLFRLACEPRRLWRRYLIGNVRFLVAVVAAERHRRRRGIPGRPQRGVET